ncbi:MAG: alpha/beta hydrolase [Firmicutes bacterium]|nr:alpha/beta hydrolase [Bacillota bacterium]
MPMRTDHYFDSNGEGKIHYCRWTPDGDVKAIVQIVHGIAEYAQRYDHFANYLNGFGILVVAEDHMGHGKSMETGTRGYFAGGWFAAVEDICQLYRMTREEFPDVPYVLFGHSMGSFLARTILIRHPEMALSAAILCGTGWMPAPVLQAGRAAGAQICKKNGEREPSEFMQSLAFGSYNRKVEHPRTAYDWLNRDNRAVDAYLADPACGFTASAGLLRDMLGGMLYNQEQKNLARMNPALPVFFIAGGDDPVGSYGKGVRRTAEAFRKAGMRDVSVRIYPLCRHEILNEINKQEIYEDVVQWLEKYVPVSQ